MLETTNSESRIEVKSRKLFIAVPIFWSVDPFFYLSSLKLVQEIENQGFKAQFKVHFGDSAVGRARNHLTRLFLESDCTHILFMDSDLVFSVDHIRRILMDDAEIVGGLYPKKQEGQAKLVLNSLENPPPCRDDGLQEVKYVGTGFIRIAREVFERMIEQYDELWYTCDESGVKEHDFWQMGVYKYQDGSRRWLSEDWYFCQRALDLGYKIWADMNILLKHSGNAVYPLKYQERELYEGAINLNSFDAPTDCQATIGEVFNGEYDFKVDIGDSPSVIDIGSNVGSFARWCDWKWPGSRITCYEPQPDIFSYLERNCLPIRAKAINAAVGDPSKDTLFISESTRLSSSQYRHEQCGDKQIKIKVVDAAELPPCDLIKIDTEGAEGDIVERLQNVPNYLFVEFHSIENRKRVINALADKMVMIGDRRHSDEHGVMAFRRLNRN